ncbi:ABC transporter ATP-binding protein [Jiangella asiatica]|uniref:ABC transporter ATP-binding protein n=1 Tax=Jiangella asiatica TaxID=2530372 RepID=A0A4R5CIX0_9ACTN|nr:ABC transporter ATP-binding protein [Jiangella asiatica]TDE00209.1 ABC transporter ATP-binding protein [Jiangella asiatica]
MARSRALTDETADATAAGTPKLELVRITKRFHRRGAVVTALDDVTLAVPAGQFCTVLGPSGCGKSTLLHIAAGLERPTAGEARIDGRPAGGPGPHRCMVFQSFALFPSMTVVRNVEFGLRVAKVSGTKRRDVAMAQLERVGLAGFADAYPHELSGGMQQRVAIARALVLEPDLLLMDEPFGALDAQTRVTMQEEVAQLVARSGVTTVFVTHSVEEAIYLGDRIVVMSARPGRVKESIDVAQHSAWRDQPAHDVMNEPEFARLRQHIWTSVREEISAASAEQRIS